MHSVYTAPALSITATGEQSVSQNIAGNSSNNIGPSHKLIDAEPRKDIGEDRRARDYQDKLCPLSFI